MPTTSSALLHVEAATLDVPAGMRARWDGLKGASGALAIANAARAARAPVLVVTPDAPEAQRIEAELRYFLAGAIEVLELPDWETLPYDRYSPHHDIVAARLRTLSRLPGLGKGIVIAPVATLLGRLSPQSYLDAHVLELSVGDTLDVDAFRQRLTSAGYRNVGQVMEHGEFAVRGALLDLFPMGGDQPLRFDLMDDEIDTIRAFDPESQRTIETRNEVRMLPAREFPMSDAGITGFRRAWRTVFEGDPMAATMYRDVSNGHTPAGIEYYLPLFFDDTATLFDYLPEATRIVLAGDVYSAAETVWDDLRVRYEERRHDRERPVLPPEQLFMRVDAFMGEVGKHPRAEVASVDGDLGLHDISFANASPANLPVESRSEDPLKHLKAFLDGFDGPVLIAADSPGRRETLDESLRRNGLRPDPCDSWAEFVQRAPQLALGVAPLERGLVLHAAGEHPARAVITEAQLFGARAAQARRRQRGRKKDAESIIRDLTELAVGAPVVHEDHGVGRYRGLVTLDMGGAPGEYLLLEYAEEAKLYVPVAFLHLISRYSGLDAEAAPLHRLGSGQWEKAKKKAAEKAFDVAAELLDVQAQREARQGRSLKPDGGEMRAFEAGFPFEETPDQAAAIDAVLEDLAAKRPMDRLVCGDVGFGKTEVALRAAFAAVQCGQQVAILVPTTLLAQQHFQTFKDRFADWAVSIEQLSRFRTKKERTTVLEQLHSGKLDIVVGTHQVISEGIRFDRLGLVIIDEEHRFGVRHKERLKRLRSEVDVLTLTATPIPRTLNLALSGMRELSLIATPPEKRLSVKTFVRQWDGPLLREAIQRELRRGGQVFFVHNKVENIARMAREVEELVPEAAVGVAHGQMPERELERTMLDFYHRRFNVLVCTTIIETGIDIPTANTMVINRADRFGLAQLHQLRGRVGRSHHRAYAYLVVPEPKAMTADARKRLDAIESLEDLGIGFTLATHDLEIRGAGELLGQNQSGQIQEVGYTLYTDLLNRAVTALKSGRDPGLSDPLHHGPEIDLRAPALIPEDYLPDVHARLTFYKRIASARDEDELRELREEMVDRFGPLHDQTRNLFRVTGLKLKAAASGVRKADIGGGGGRIVFDANGGTVDPAQVVQLIQKQPRTFKLEGGDKLRMTMDLPDVEARAEALENLLDVIAA